MLWPPEPPSSASGPSWGPLRLLPHFSVFIFFLFKKNSTFVFRVSHTPGTSAGQGSRASASGPGPPASGRGVPPLRGARRLRPERRRERPHGPASNPGRGETPHGLHGTNSSPGTHSRLPHRETRPPRRRPASKTEKAGRETKGGPRGDRAKGPAEGLQGGGRRCRRCSRRGRKWALGTRPVDAHRASAAAPCALSAALGVQLPPG